MKIFEYLRQYNSTSRLTPLQKRGDIQHELLHQIQFLNNEGNEILEIYHKSTSVVILYRRFYKEIRREDETGIMLRLLVINKNGVLQPLPSLNAFFNIEHTEIELADIDIKEDIANEGYGSILLSALIEIAKNKKTHSISGWISRVDENHIDRLVHFYKKHNFKVILQNEMESKKIGNLLWINNYFSNH